MDAAGGHSGITARRAPGYCSCKTHLKERGGSQPLLQEHAQRLHLLRQAGALAGVRQHDLLTVQVKLAGAGLRGQKKSMIIEHFDAVDRTVSWQ